MKFLSVIIVYSIWFTQVIFILSLINIIKAIKNNKDHKGSTIACVLSFWFMIVPFIFVSLLFMNS